MKRKKIQKGLLTMRKSKQKLMPVLLGLAVLLFCTSCGYHMGSVMHPQIQTIAIAEVKNE